MLTRTRHPETAISGDDLARTELAWCPHLASSEGRNWGGIRVDEFGPFQAVRTEAMPPRDHHVVLIARDHSSCVIQERLGQSFENPFGPGDMSLIPAGTKASFRGRLPSHLRIGLSAETLTEAAEQLGRTGAYVRPELANVFRAKDPFVERLGAVFSAELLRPAHPIQGILIESLVTALSLHLLRNYGAPTGVQGGFAGSKVVAIRRALEVMNQPLDTRISLAELAEASGISRFHLSRIFKKHFGMSPIAYLERARIERAKDLIRRAEMSLADVAQTVGFADQSHFTRRFKQYAGSTPGVFAREHARKRLPSQARVIRAVRLPKRKKGPPCHEASRPIPSRLLSSPASDTNLTPGKPPADFF
jgi:AraC family transcriptional regulator